MNIQFQHGGAIDFDIYKISNIFYIPLYKDIQKGRRDHAEPSQNGYFCSYIIYVI